MGGQVGGGGVRVDVNEELKMGKFTRKKKYFFFLGGGVGGSGGGGSVGGRVGGEGGVRVDVNTMLGVVGDVGYGGM